MNWSKAKLVTDSGESINAQAPVIISASRSTDIPKFYTDWLMSRLESGYLKWKNPFNGVPLYVSFSKARLIVFWSKDPSPIVPHLERIAEIIPNYYFQFTLNDYDSERLEPGVPEVKKRIDTFIELSEKIGKEKVIWRFDPLILTNEIGVDDLLRKVENIGNQLKNHTRKLVFSFADIKMYKKVQNNLRRSSIPYKEFNERTMRELAAGLRDLNANWNLELASCAEKIELKQYNILHNKCIDDDLIIELFSSDKLLMDFLGIRISPPDMFRSETAIEKTRKIKDKGQRELCGCIISKDIGEYNTCPHLCEYCYANTSKELAVKNWKQHKLNPLCEMIKGY